MATREIGESTALAVVVTVLASLTACNDGDGTNVIDIVEGDYEVTITTVERCEEPASLPPVDSLWRLRVNEGFVTMRVDSEGQCGDEVLLGTLSGMMVVWNTSGMLSVPECGSDCVFEVIREGTIAFTSASFEGEWSVTELSGSTCTCPGSCINGASVIDHVQVLGRKCEGDCLPSC